MEKLLYSGTVWLVNWLDREHTAIDLNDLGVRWLWFLLVGKRKARGMRKRPEERESNLSLSLFLFLSLSLSLTD